MKEYESFRRGGLRLKGRPAKTAKRRESTDSRGDGTPLAKRPRAEEPASDVEEGQLLQPASAEPVVEIISARTAQSLSSSEEVTEGAEVVGKLGGPPAGTLTESPKSEKESSPIDTGAAEVTEEDPDIAQIMAHNEATAAEKSFMLARHLRRSRLLGGQQLQTHREKVAAFNEQLSKLSEHFDIPKVGPG